MAESILKQPEIAQYIGTLFQEVRAIKRQLRLDDKEDELRSGEEPQELGGWPAINPEIHTPIVRVTTISSDTCFLARRQVPADTSVSSSGWMDDPDLPTLIEVCVPPNVELPSVEDILGVRWTGNYPKFEATLATTIPVPRYGLFGAAAEAIKAFLVTSINTDTLSCFELNTTDPATTVVGTEVFEIAKPFELRVTPFDGNVINGRAFVYASNVRRTVTGSGFTPEVQTVVPTWIESFTVITAVPLGNGTQIASVTLQDITHRVWAQEFTPLTSFGP